MVNQEESLAIENKNEIEDICPQEKSRWQRFLEKLPHFFMENYGFFAIPLFVFIVFGFALSQFEIWPFGTAIIASYDMLAQICPILEHFFDVFQGESGLFHSFHVGGGMDMFGILAYCAISPFTFLFLLAGKGGSLYLVSIVLPLKFSCIGISAFIFLRVYFKRIPEYMKVVLALLYAYSGYAYVANTYIIWMDIMMYMPLLGAGIIELFKTGKIRLFVIGLALNIYACFSIVCFSFFTLFPVLVCYVLICKKKSEWRELLSKLCLAFVIAVGIALPVLVPSLMAYTKAGRNTGLFSRVFEVMKESDVLEGKLNIHLYEKFSYIFCDSTFIALTVVYFMRCKKGDKLAVFLLVALAYLLLPCIIDESMLLLNMGSYYSYALRFGFLFSLYFLFTSAKAIDEMIEDKLDDVEIGQVKSAISLIVVAIISVAAAIFTLVFFRFILNEEYKNSKLVTAIFGTGGEAAPFEDFFPLFAHSEGGCEGTVVLFVVVCVVFAIASLLVYFKCVKIKDIASYLCILALSQTVFFSFALVKGDRQSGSAQKYDYYQQMIDEIAKTEEDEYYRLKNYSYYISSDSPIILGNYSHTFFSSMADAKNLSVAKFFDYGGSKTNSTRSNGGNSFSNSLLNYRYIVFDASDASKATSSTYSSYTTFTGISIHRTPSVKVSYTKNNKTKTYTWKDIPENLHGKGKWSNLKIEISGNKFSGYLNGELVYTVTMDSSQIKTVSAVTKNALGSFRNIKLTKSDGTKIPSKWLVPAGWEQDGEVYTTKKTNGTFDLIKAQVKTIEGDVLFTAGSASDDHIGFAVTMQSGTTYRLVVEPNVIYMVYKNDYAFPGAMVIKNADLNFDADNRKEGYAQLANMLCEGDGSIKANGASISTADTGRLSRRLKEKAVDYKLVKNGIKFEKITAEKDQMLLLTYTNIDGYKVYVNGKEREFKENTLDFMMVELDEGENVVEIKYTSPYIKYIIIGVVMAVLVTLLAWLVYKRKPTVFDRISIALPYMAVGLAIALTLFFFIFPTGVYLKKFFGTYIKLLY